MTPTDTDAPQRQMSRFEAELRQRIEEKFPEPTPAQQAELERQIQATVYERQRRQQARKLNHNLDAPAMTRSGEMEGPSL